MTALTDDELPPLFRAADSTSLRGQRHFINATRARLIGLVGAAGFGLFVWPTGSVDLAGVAALFAFLLAVFAEVFLLSRKPDKDWYDGRAAAESIKTLSWRYAVGGGPFDVHHDFDVLFSQRLQDVLEETRGDVLIPAGVVGPQITEAMRSLRSEMLEERRSVYLQQRVHDQAAWYSGKAAWNSRRADAWAIGLIVVEVLGGSAAVLKAAGVLPLDVLGLAGAAVAAGVAWVSVKQHRTLARAYSVAAHELGAIAVRAQSAVDEESWAAFVDDAEDAISREHTLWRASHK